MITAVADTNVLASGLVRRNPGSAVVQVVEAWRSRRYSLVVSEHIIAELRRTLDQPYFRRHISQEQAARFVDVLRRQAKLTSITVEVRGVATHPEDDLTLATAVSAHADYLVTGDTQLQRLGTYQGVRPLSPRQLLAVLATQDLAGEGVADES